MFQLRQRAWMLVCGIAFALTFEDFAAGHWGQGTFGAVVTIMLFLASYIPRVRIMRPMPYPMPSPDVVSELVGNRPIGFCEIGPVPHEPHVWYQPDNATKGLAEGEYACLGHYCQHPERHV